MHHFGSQQDSERHVVAVVAAVVAAVVVAVVVAGLLLLEIGR